MLPYFRCLRPTNFLEERRFVECVLLAQYERRINTNNKPRCNKTEPCSSSLPSLLASTLSVLALRHIKFGSELNPVDLNEYRHALCILYNLHVDRQSLQRLLQKWAVWFNCGKFHLARLVNYTTSAVVITSFSHKEIGRQSKSTTNLSYGF